MPLREVFAGDELHDERDRAVASSPWTWAMFG